LSTARMPGPFIVARSPRPQYAGRPMRSRDGSSVRGSQHHARVIKVLSDSVLWWPSAVGSPPCTTASRSSTATAPAPLQPSPPSPGSLCRRRLCRGAWWSIRGVGWRGGRFRGRFCAGFCGQFVGGFCGRFEGVGATGATWEAWGGALEEPRQRESALAGWADVVVLK
jgi:hypothetical protein